VREARAAIADLAIWSALCARVAVRWRVETASSFIERAQSHYVLAKLRVDPVARLVAQLAAEQPRGFGSVVDLGAGCGQLPILLLELGVAERVTGFDWDERKVRSARRAASGKAGGWPSLPAHFVHADVCDVRIPNADTVFLVDVLHYLPFDAQDALVDRAFDAVQPGGRLVVREADSARGLRSIATRVEEGVFTWLRFNRGQRVRMRPAADIVARLEARGALCSVDPAWGSTPFSNVLILARRLG
jgi:SAM-dependent methyltransferase